MFLRNSSPARWPAREMLLLVGALLAAIVGVSSASASGRSVGPVAAHLWLTTVDGKYKLTEMGEVQFGTGQPSVPTVVVDPSRTCQTMDGFGSAVTDSSAVVLYRMSPPARSATMRMLFDPRTGDGLSYLRQPIGGSDFVATAPTRMTTSRPAPPTTRSVTSASPTTKPRSCRCCARPSA